MSDLIMKTNGTPFISSRAAKTQQGYLEKKGVTTTVIPVDGGFALQRVQRVLPPEEIVQKDEPIKPETPVRKRERIPLGTRNVLKYPPRPGYKRMVVNDVDDNVLRYQDAGWEPVRQEDLVGQDPRTGAATRMGLTARRPVGGGIHGVLMEIPEEWHREDVQAQQDKIKAMEDDMKRIRSRGIENAYGEIKID